MSYTYIKDGVSNTAIYNFLKNQKELCKTEIQAFSVIRDGELLCRIAVPPYEIDDNRQLFSLSKSFCSTAVGFAVDEGLFKVTDKIVDIFPECCPNIISEKLSKMTVHDVLSMSTGHKECVMSVMKEADDPVKAFMSVDLEYNPGEKFVYNTGATLLLSIIVQKYTGMTVFEYLYEKYFRYLDSCPEKWDVISTGYCEGGVGLYASIIDVENLGKLYLGKGVLNGRRFLSEEWVNMATSIQIKNPNNGSPEWCSGYGYQFWRNSRDGYRGDGACGQLCFVLPSTDTIISVQCENCGPMQNEINEIYKLSEHIEDGEKMPDCEFEAFIRDFYNPESIKIEDFNGFGKQYKLSENPHPISYIDFSKGKNEIIIKLTGKAGIQTVTAGIGEHKYNCIYLKNLKPTLTGLCASRHEECKFSCCVSECTKDRLVISLRYRNAPQSQKIVFTAIENELEMEYICRTCDVIPEVKNIKGKCL